VCVCFVQVKIRLQHVYEVWSDTLTEDQECCITRCWLKETVTV